MTKEQLQARFQELQQNINKEVAEQNQIIGKLDLLSEQEKEIKVENA